MLRQREPRQHDEAHLDFIRALPCTVCLNNIETQAAHLSRADTRAAKRHVGMAEKAHDRWALPLCGRCHARQHEEGEDKFWDEAMIDPTFVCLALWSVSGDYERGEIIIRAQH